MPDKGKVGVHRQTWTIPLSIVAAIAAIGMLLYAVSTETSNEHGGKVSQTTNLKFSQP